MQPLNIFFISLAEQGDFLEDDYQQVSCTCQLFGFHYSFTKIGNERA